MIWTLKRIWRAAYKAVKLPLSRMHSHSWESSRDHRHLCLAARLLEPDDFHAVCPLTKKNAMIEHEDVCDECGYFAILFYDTSKDGTKSISIYSNGKEWCP